MHRRRASFRARHGSLLRPLRRHGGNDRGLPRPASPRRAGVRPRLTSRSGTRRPGTPIRSSPQGFYDAEANRTYTPRPRASRRRRRRGRRTRSRLVHSGRTWASSAPAASDLPLVVDNDVAYARNGVTHCSTRRRLSITFRRRRRTTGAVAAARFLRARPATNIDLSDDGPAACCSPPTAIAFNQLAGGADRR